VKGSEFLRRLRRIANDRGITVRLEQKRGKGSHATLYFGNAIAIMQDPKKELPTGTLHAMLKQIGLTIKDFE
jgi:mRNA interferase HicA